MYFANVSYCGKTIQTSIIESFSEVQKFALGWSHNKKSIFGKVPRFNDFSIEVYNLSKPCSSQHVDTPSILYY